MKRDRDTKTAHPPHESNQDVKGAWNHDLSDNVPVKKHRPSLSQDGPGDETIVKGQSVSGSSSTTTEGPSPDGAYRGNDPGQAIPFIDGEKVIVAESTTKASPQSGSIPLVTASPAASVERTERTELVEPVGPTTPVNFDDKVKLAKCPHCTRSYERTGHLLRHIFIAHLKDQAASDAQSEERKSKPKRFTCSQCSRSYIRETGLVKHVAKIHGNPDMVTGKNDPSEESITYSYNCPHCSRCYPHQKRLARHIDVSHPDISDIDDELLSEQLNDGHNRFRCPLCSERFSHNGRLIRHIDSIHVYGFSYGRPQHFTEDLINCPYCSKVYHLKGQLARHIAATHATTRCDSENIKAESGDGASPPTTKDQAVLSPEPAPAPTDEKDNHNNNHPENENLSKKEFRCSQCSRYYSTQSNLDQHSKMHSGLNMCDVCGANFTFKGTLVKHLKKHAKPGPYFNEDFNLDEALERLSQRKALTSKSKPERPPGTGFTCPHCGQTYTHQSNLSMHLRVHKGLNVCNLCGENFSRHDRLKKHLEGHSGNRGWRFSCPQCDVWYANKGTYTKHMITHMITSDGGVKSCKVCNAEFESIDDLKTHFQSTHAIPKAA